MEYRFSPEQEELGASVRRLLVERASPRAAYDGGPAVDRDLWHALAEVGVCGLGIAEADGGSGGDLLDQIVVAEELGRAVAPVPFLGSTVLAGLVVGALGSPAQRAELGGAIAAGDLVATVALTGPGTANGPDAVRIEHGRLSGHLPFVIDGAAADIVLVPVEQPGGRASVHVVRTADAGVDLVDLPALDRTRRPGSVELADVAAERLDGSDGAADDAAGDAYTAALEAARRAACVVLAADATGAATYALELSAEYAKVRQQFGRPIGMFQAVKHKAADMLVAVESARSATYFGAWEIVADTSDAGIAAAVAKATATENAVHVVGDAIQIHGGIAITWDHDLHLYLRRVKTDAQLLGEPSQHLEVVATHLLGPA